jgi:hypothetical protein
MSAGNISWGVKGWQPYRFHVSTVLKSGSLNLMEPTGPVQGLLCLQYGHHPKLIDAICVSIRMIFRKILLILHWVFCIDWVPKRYIGKVSWYENAGCTALCNLIFFSHSVSRFTRCPLLITSFSNTIVIQEGSDFWRSKQGNIRTIWSPY